jgi:hypothetical protein
MANESSLVGNCVAPFLDAAKFPGQGGYIGGRLCSQVKLLPDDPTCCLPCPSTKWIYPDSFNTYTQVSEWLNVIGLILLVFMLISYIVLPAQKTRSHYLSVCLVVSAIMIALGFTIPLAAKPEQCFNEITPNDMYSSAECAWSGAFIVAGGLSATMWIFIRALSMNLQICWDIVPGRKFFYGSQALGWGLPAALFTATMTVTGVSFRFGSACHVNHPHSMADFWGPLLGLAGAAGLLQLVTFGYCIHVYLKNLWSDQAGSSTNASGSGLPSYSGSVRTQTARAVYQRLKKVLWLQWRGICIVSIILVDVVFFSIVFVYLDGLQNSLTADWQRIEPWLTCLALNPTNKDACISKVSHIIVNEGTVIAVLLLLSLTGFQVFIFLVRPSVFEAWVDFVRCRFSPHRQEFVSLDARQPDILARSNSKQELLKYDHVRGHLSTTFEMQKPALRSLSTDLDSKSPNASTVLSSPDETYRSPLQRVGPPDDAAAGRWSDRSSNTPRWTERIQNARPTKPNDPSPAYAYSGSMNMQSSGYFDNHQTYHDLQAQQQQRRGYTREGSTDSLPRTRPMSPPSAMVGGRPESRDRDRRYQAHHTSFSRPQTPSRQNSGRSVSFAAFADPGRDTYSGGRAIPEAGESQEDLNNMDPRNQSLDRRW